MSTPYTPTPAIGGAEQQRPSGRHPVSIGHLVMGLAFLGIVAVWLLVQSDVVDDDHIRWLLPVPWVIAGAAGLVATTLTARGRWGTRQTGWVDPAPAPSTAELLDETARGTAEDPAEDPGEGPAGETEEPRPL